MSETERPLPEWPRACGAALFRGQIKANCSDFEVREELGFELSGDGEHDYLWIEKRDANTAWVARELARFAGVRPGDVGYAGLKDRRATTTQWFSVRRPTGAGTDWSVFELPGVSLVEIARHGRKLKRGAHRGNRFRVAIRGDLPRADAVLARLERLRGAGVPNYFGEQRFGRGGSNLGLAEALFSGKRLPREKRSIALSAARSFIFNEVLAERVRAGSWDQPLEGDVFSLDGSNSVFRPDAIDEVIEARIGALDIHPSGPLWGVGDPGTGGRVAAIEASVVKRYPGLAAGLEADRLRMARRALRFRVDELAANTEDGILWLEFRLGRGSYATSVIREIVEAVG